MSMGNILTAESRHDSELVPLYVEAVNHLSRRLEAFRQADFDESERGDPDIIGIWFWRLAHRVEWSRQFCHFTGINDISRQIYSGPMGAKDFTFPESERTLLEFVTSVKEHFEPALQHELTRQFQDSAAYFQTEEHAERLSAAKEAFIEAMNDERYRWDFHPPDWPVGPGFSRAMINGMQRLRRSIQHLLCEGVDRTFDFGLSIDRGIRPWYPPHAATREEQDEDSVLRTIGRPVSAPEPGWKDLLRRHFSAHFDDETVGLFREHLDKLLESESQDGDRRVDEIAFTACRRALTRTRWKRRTGVSTTFTDAGYLDLQVDDSNRLLQRKGYDKVIEFGSRDVLWAILSVLLRSREDFLDGKNLANAASADYEPLRTNVGRLRRALKPINLSISHREYRLEELPVTNREQ